MGRVGGICNRREGASKDPSKGIELLEKYDTAIRGGRWLQKECTDIGASP